MHLSSQRQSQTHFTSTVSANGIAAVRSLLGTRVPAIRQRQSVRRRVPGGKYDLCVRAGQSSPFQQSHADRPKHERGSRCHVGSRIQVPCTCGHKVNLKNYLHLLSPQNQGSRCHAPVVTSSLGCTPRYTVTVLRRWGCFPPECCGRVRRSPCGSLRVRIRPHSREFFRWRCNS